MDYKSIADDYYDLLPWVNVHMGDVHGHSHCIQEATYKEIANMIDVKRK